MVIKIEKITELPYYNNHHYYINFNNNNNNNNNNIKYQQLKQKQISYGIICVSRDGYIVMNKSPPYIKTHMKTINKNYHKTDFGLVKLNTNEKYNLILSLFPNSTMEGEYTLPKGKMDDMDKKNSVFTKVREFIEETKYTHPIFPFLLNNHYENPNFKSFLNDENFILRESWLGLDNKIYKCEYSVFIIKSITELVPLNNNNNNNIVSFKYFLNNFKVYQNCNKYYKRYKQSSNLDSQKKTLFIPIKQGINLLNQHKLNVEEIHNNDSRIQVYDIYKIMSR